MTAADPAPHLRCRCVSWGNDGGWQDNWHQRCTTRPTQEDGLCDHCRQTGPCRDPLCADRDGTRGIGCCLAPYAARALVDLLTPCAPAGAPPF